LTATAPLAPTPPPEDEPADCQPLAGGDPFSGDLTRLEAAIQIPYPERAEILDEVRADLRAAYQHARAQGLDDQSARQQALAELGMAEETRVALEGVHATAPLRLLGRLPVAVRSWLRALATAAPLAGLVLFLVVEVPVNRFLLEGGGSVFLILAFGSLGLLLEMQRFFIWFVVRDHSPEALRRNTPTPLYLASATVLLGVLGTSMKYYSFLSRWGGGLREARRGLSEPLTLMILACCLAALTVLLHSALCVGLRALRVPDHETNTRH
jgi:hypothetical protein